MFEAPEYASDATTVKNKKCLVSGGVLVSVVV